MNDLVLRAEETHSDLYAAVDLVLDKLERQIRKHKTKVNRKMREKGAEKYLFAALESEANVAVATEEDELELVRTKRFNLQTLYIEEKMDVLDLLNQTKIIGSLKQEQ